MKIKFTIKNNWLTFHTINKDYISDVITDNNLCLRICPTAFPSRFNVHGILEERCALIRHILMDYNTQYYLDKEVEEIWH